MNAAPSAAARLRGDQGTVGHRRRLFAQFGRPPAAREALPGALADLAARELGPLAPLAEGLRTWLGLCRLIDRLDRLGVARGPGAPAGAGPEAAGAAAWARAAERDSREPIPPPLRAAQRAAVLAARERLQARFGRPPRHRAARAAAALAAREFGPAYTPQLEGLSWLALRALVLRLEARGLGGEPLRTAGAGGGGACPRVLGAIEAARGRALAARRPRAANG